MKEIYRGVDRAKTEFVITTSTLDKEDRLHLIIITRAKTVDYVFFCTETYNHQTQWNVTRCKAVQKAIENKKIRIKKRKIKNVARSKRPCYAIGVHYAGGTEYVWSVPKRYVDKLQAGMWVRVSTKFGTATVKVLRVVPAEEIDYKPTQSVINITPRQDYKLFTFDEKREYSANRKKEKEQQTIQNETDC